MEYANPLHCVTMNETPRIYTTTAGKKKFEEGGSAYKRTTHKTCDPTEHFALPRHLQGARTDGMKPKCPKTDIKEGVDILNLRLRPGPFTFKNHRKKVEKDLKMEGELTSKLHRRQTGRNGELEGEIQCNSERKFEWGRRLNKEMDLTGKFIKSTSDLPSCCLNSNEEQTEIQEFFRGVDVLITGATGFIGKILIEKLLVSCPNIGNFYLVIREKKGKSPEERFDALFKDHVFSRLHKLVPDFRNKLIAVNGDVSKPNLGMSDSDYEMISEKVSVIFHGAANVRFDERIREAASINIIGVIEMLKFARKCKNLKCIMHVSTAYANCNALNKDITEEFYPVAYDYKKLLELIDKNPDEYLDKVTRKLIGPWPNTYSFTKQIAEDVIQKEGQGLPLGLFRPGIIIATYNEPIRGWTDNIYGPTGVIVGAGTGILRVIQSDKEVVANMVPVDLVVNGLIAAAWKTFENFKNEKKKIEIYNYVSSARNPIRWGEFSYWSARYGQNWPTVVAVWYEEFHQIKSRLLFLLLVFLLHTLPSYIADGVRLLCGKKPKMIKIYKKINKFNEVMAYFSTKEWNFTDDNVLNLWKSLSPKDQEIYPFNIEDMDWDFHAQAHLLGLRVYLVKDDIDTLETGRKKWKRLRILHRCLQVALLSLFSWIIFRLFNLANSLVFD